MRFRKGQKEELKDKIKEKQRKEEGVGGDSRGGCGKNKKEE